MSRLQWATVWAIPLVLAGCSLLFRGPEPPSTTCAGWLSLPDRSQIDLATSMVDSEVTLESVRQAQHREPGVAKAVLIQDVVQSITKNCEVMHEPDLLVVDLTKRLYAGDRVYESIDPAAPTPGLGP
jgi:hypothetical protein